MSDIETSSPARRLLTATLAFALCGLAAAACGDDGNNPPAVDAGGGGSGSDGGGVGSSAPPAVLVAERVFTPDARLYYVSVLPSIPTAAIDRTKALELTSADIEVFGGKVFIRDRDKNTMTRYSVDNTLKLVQEDQFSFQPAALANNRFSSVYLAPNKAYLMDSTGWRLIGWDPSAMALTGEKIALDTIAHHEFTGSTGQISPAVQVGGKFMAAVYWEDFTNLVLYPGSGVIVFDPAAPANTVPTFVEDHRLGGAFRITADGTDAYVTGVTDGAVRFFGSVFKDANNDPLPSSGLLKLPGGTAAFDVNYFVNMEDITKSKAIWAIHRLSATKMLVQVYDPAAAAPANLTAYNGDTTDFIFGIVDTDAKTFTPFDTAVLPAGGRANSGNYQIDGKFYIQTSNATGSQSFAVSPDGTVTTAFPVPAGDVWQISRIR